ncbi:MAG TPA: hypothetical protein PLK08_05560 [Phycisphaerae bacterium]|nr:hypothetical protein [Phycisphaerae bacterium]
MQTNREELEEYKARFKVAHQLVNGLQRQIDSAKRSRSALKGQLTRERKRNAEAKELFELLEWAEGFTRLTYRHETGDWSIVFILDSISNCIINKSLLLALREAKKNIETQK